MWPAPLSLRPRPSTMAGYGRSCSRAASRFFAPISSIRVASNKAYTAARERKPTKEIGEKIRHPERGFDIAFYGDRRFCGWGGGIPIRKEGHVVGAIGVSGLSSAEDIALATVGLELIATGDS